MDLTALFDDIDRACDHTIPHQATIIAPDVQGLAFMLAHVREAKRKLSDAEKMVEDELVKSMAGKEETVEGLGVITMRSGAQRKGWDHDSLIRALPHAIGPKVVPEFLIDKETGEEYSGLSVVADLLTELRKATSFSWKTTGLRPLGIDPDQFCETTWGRKTVTTPTLHDPEEGDDVHTAAGA